MTASDAITEPAPAKINLCLHVTGQREDGYHLLDSLVLFTEIGDEVVVEPADDLTLQIIGPFSQDLRVEADNLVLRAARTFGTDRGARITLRKELPVASGIGGGSADAAATLRALSRLWNLPLPPADKLLDLGADVPVCMSYDVSRMQGIGENVTRLGPAPPLDVLLVNPRVHVPTPTVFKGLATKANAPLDEPMPDIFEGDAWIDWLGAQRNDLEAPAIAAHPVIGQVIEVIRAQKGCRMARMSGSGATCFALFENDQAALQALEAVQKAHPDWWVHQTYEAPYQLSI